MEPYIVFVGTLQNSGFWLAKKVFLRVVGWASVVGSGGLQTSRTRSERTMLNVTCIEAVFLG